MVNAVCQYVVRQTIRFRYKVGAHDNMTNAEQYLQFSFDQIIQVPTVSLRHANHRTGCRPTQHGPAESCVCSLFDVPVRGPASDLFWSFWSFFVPFLVPFWSFFVPFCVPFCVPFLFLFLLVFLFTFLFLFLFLFLLLFVPFWFFLEPQRTDPQTSLEIGPGISAGVSGWRNMRFVFSKYL